MHVFNGVGDYPQAKTTRKIGGFLAWLFSGSYVLITEEIFGHNIWQVGEIPSLGY